MIKIFQKQAVLHFLILLLFFLISFVFNHFPANSIVAGGDFYELISYKSTLNRFAYAWFNQIGQGTYNGLFVAYPFYFLLSLIDNFLSSGYISSSIIFIFITSSFYSFFIALKLIPIALNSQNKIISSFIYALNPFVVAILSYPWGYTHHFLIYPFFPLLMAIFINVFWDKNPKLYKYYLFLLINTVSIVAYNNVAFFALVMLSYLTITITSLVTKLVPFNRESIIKACILFLIAILINLPLLLPNISSVIQTSGKAFNNQTALGGENYLYDWVKSTSNNPFNSFNLLIDSTRYPYNSGWLSSIYLVVNSLFFLFMVWMISKNQKIIKIGRKNGAAITTTLFSFIFFAVLSVRYYGPFELLNQLFYQSPFFIFFRSADKIMIAVAFFYTLSIALLLNVKKKLSQIGLIIISVLLIPFVSQVIINSLNDSYNSFAHKTTAEYQYVVSMPSEYSEFAKKISTPQKTAILSLPYSIKNSISWSNYPAWKFVGHDILHLIFSQRYISPNVYDHPPSEGLMSFQFDTNEELSPELIFNDIQKFGTQYVIYHKDIDLGRYYSAMNVKSAIDNLENSEKLQKIEDNEYFSAYKIPDNYVLPLISIADATTTYKRINPSLYVIDVEGLDTGTLKFLQSYDPNWHLYLADKKQPICSTDSFNYANSSATECKWQRDNFLSPYLYDVFFQKSLSVQHDLCNDFANCWQIDDDSIDNKYIVIYYEYQNIVYYYAIFCVVITIIMVSFIAYENKKTKNK